MENDPFSSLIYPLEVLIFNNYVENYQRGIRYPIYPYIDNIFTILNYQRVVDNNHLWIITIDHILTIY